MNQIDMPNIIIYGMKCWNTSEIHT